jgi:hypothetical protein
VEHEFIFIPEMESLYFRIFAPLSHQLFQYARQFDNPDMLFVSSGMEAAFLKANKSPKFTKM